MNVSAEKMMVILVVSSFALTSISVLVVRGGSLTREEAIEISRNTCAVQEDLSYGGIPGVTTDYWNATFIRSLKQKYPALREIENLPEDHGVWRVFWAMLPGYYVLHFIDELTGKVLHESILYVG